MFLKFTLMLTVNKMSYLTNPVIYLEPSDFTSNGVLKHFKDTVCVIMVQANFCGHCTTAKPAFQAFAENNPHITCLTIQGDSDPKINKIIQKIKPTFEGFPDYFLMINGKRVNKNIEGRSVKDLKKFAEF